MKKLLLFSLFFIFAGCDSEVAVTPTPVISNTLCPITGEPINDSVAPVSVGPYTVRFHSLACRKKFTQATLEQQKLLLNSVLPEGGK
jgi:hypothetical protein